MLPLNAINCEIARKRSRGAHGDSQFHADHCDMNDARAGRGEGGLVH
jgi:hypothetical protein